MNEISCYVYISLQPQKNRFRVKTTPPLLVLTYNFATAISETTTLNPKTLTTALQLVSLFQNCELKQEPCTLATALHQPLKFHNREIMYFFTFAGVGLDCSERVTSQWIFVLTLNRASALTVSDNKIHFLLPLPLVATTKRVGLASKRTSYF